MRTLRRRPFATAAVAAAAAVCLGGCSDTGFDAQTNQRYQASIGADHRGDIDVLGTLLVANPDGSATLSAGLVNHNDDSVSLTGLTAAPLTGTGTLTVTAPDADPEVEPRTLAQLGRTDGAGVYTVADVDFGGYAQLTLTFSDSSEVVIEAPIVTRNDTYADIATG